MEEKQENLLQNTMQEKTKYYGNRIWRDMSSLGKWLILAVVIARSSFTSIAM